MGEARRRKLLDPNYGRRSNKMFLNVNLLNVINTTENLRIAARDADFPRELALRLFIAIDSGQLLPPPLESGFPQEWGYKLRCLKSDNEAMDWIRSYVDKIKKHYQEKRLWDDDLHLPVVFLNTVKIAGMAILEAQMKIEMTQALFDR